MASYYLDKGIKKYFRFFENRYWDDSQESIANYYFIFEVSENNLGELGYIYWAHIALWKNRFANDDINQQYKIEQFEEIICNELDELGINDDPPSFGYGEIDLGVAPFFWDSPEFKVLKITPEGIHCIDDELDEFYFDFIEKDICSAEDLLLEDENLFEGSSFTCDPGDAVFMSDNDFIWVKKNLLQKIEVLNKVYSKVHFPHQIIVIH
jgi:hypothetical protein